MGIVFTFIQAMVMTSLVVKSTMVMALHVIVTDFDLLYNSFRFKQGELLRGSSGGTSIVRPS